MSDLELLMQDDAGDYVMYEMDASKQSIAQDFGPQLEIIMDCCCF